MSDRGFTDVQTHDGHPAGIKIQVEFSPDEAKRLTGLAEEAGLPLADYLRSLVSDAASARSG